jgi:hypothetical protein
MTHTLTIRPGWTPLTIVLMVIGFMIAWPIGLLVLAYILWGDRIPEFRRDASTIRVRTHFHRRYSGGESGNIAFDEYRDRELKRLEEEQRRLDEERRDFETFLRNLRRAKDQEEFDRFMAERRRAKGGAGDEAVL